jgi:uncharacterized membrane protein
MESKARLFGRPIPPLLVVLPLVAFLSTVLFDLVYLGTWVVAFAILSYILIILGVLGSLPVLLAGIIKFHSIPSQTVSKTISAWHLFGNLVVVALFALSWLFRAIGNPSQPQILAVALSIAGLIMGTVAAWVSSELLDHLAEEEPSGTNANRPGQPISSQIPSANTPRIQVPVTGPKKRKEK